MHIRSMRFIYVLLVPFNAAARALDVLNFTPLNNKPIRIMYSHRDPSIRKSGTGNIFIKVFVIIDFFYPAIFNKHANLIISSFL